MHRFGIATAGALAFATTLCACGGDVFVMASGAPDGGDVAPLDQGQGGDDAGAPSSSGGIVRIPPRIVRAGADAQASDASALELDAAGPDAPEPEGGGAIADASDRADHPEGNSSSGGGSSSGSSSGSSGSGGGTGRCVVASCPACTLMTYACCATADRCGCTGFSLGCN